MKKRGVRLGIAAVILQLALFTTPESVQGAETGDALVPQLTSAVYHVPGIGPVHEGDGFTLFHLDGFTWFTVRQAPTSITSAPYGVSPTLNGELTTEIRVNGNVGRETLTLDFSNGVFSRAPYSSQLGVLFDGDNPELHNTLKILGGPSDDRVEMGEGEIVFSNFTGSTVVHFGAGVSQIVLELGGGNDVVAGLVPEPGGVVAAAGMAGAALCARRCGRRRRADLAVVRQWK